MDEIVLSLGQQSVSGFQLLLGVLGVIALLLVWLLLTIRRANRQRAFELSMSEAQNRARHVQVEEMQRLQAEMTGRMKNMAEIFSTRQNELAQTLTTRMDGMGHRLGQSLNKNLGVQQKATHDNLRALHERLAVIDKAQNNLTDLSSRVVELQHILANKQTRGAFGQGRMEAIVSDGMPSNSYDFQYTLSNGKRPDCVIHLPDNEAVLVIDAKFPLEGWTQIDNAQNAEEDKAARARFRQDLKRHIKDIADRYFIIGETQETAFLFVPSESLFADLHEYFDDLVQLAHRARIVIVSPSLLMLSIQVVQSILKDVQMREQAHIIQHEVKLLMDDIGRLDERVDKLQTHFQNSIKSIEQIQISTAKIVKRGRKIEEVDVQDYETEALQTSETALSKRGRSLSSNSAHPHLPLMPGDEYLR